MFQLESALGKDWAEQIAPHSIEHLAAVGAVLRPGCLRVIDDGKTMTQRYADRKNDREQVTIKYECLADILGPTYGVLVFQEQAMQIAVKVAGFDEQEADKLRKAIGKKLPEEMAKVKIIFIEGAKRVELLNEEEALEVFGWIESSQRYSFNKSHSWAYGINGYWSAFCKAHFPLEFYEQWLSYSKDCGKPYDEIRELVNDAKEFGFPVKCPDIRLMNKNFRINRKSVTFGITDVKGVGDSQFSVLQEILEESKIDPSKCKWFTFLTKVLNRIHSDVAQNLVSSGALDCFKISRTKMLYEFDKWKILTEKEQNLLLEKYDGKMNMAELISTYAKTKKEGGVVHNKTRVPKVQSIATSLQSPPYSMDDNPQQIAKKENVLLGISITYSMVDSVNEELANCTCLEFKQGFAGAPVLAVEIQNVKEVMVKNGPNRGSKMGFLTVADHSGSLETLVVFSNSWGKYSGMFEPGNVVGIAGDRDKKNPKTLIVKKVWQI